MEWNIQVLGATLVGLSLFGWQIAIWGVKDSPVDVTGGSIHATIPWYHIWHKADRMYSSAETPNNDLISTYNFQNAPASITDTGGWTIAFSTTNAQYGKKHDSALLCSNRNCDSKGFDKDGKIYLRTSNYAQWKRRFWGLYWASLDYRDLGSDCGATRSDSRPCDHLKSVTITTYQKGSQEYECPDGLCTIRIGR
jgi:hypothetical protein